MAQPSELPFAAPESGPEPRIDGEDFVFRFRLDPPAPQDAMYDDALLELVRGLLADLLDAAVLTHHGERVMVDGFRLLHDPETQYEIWPRPTPDGSEPDSPPDAPV